MFVIPRVDLDSGHDIANGAPDQFIASVRDFLANRIDAQPPTGLTRA